MSIDLPQPVVDFLGFIGISWPDISEDDVTTFGQYVKGLVSDLEDIESRASKTVSDIIDAYQGASTQKFAEVWKSLDENFLRPTLELGGTVGDAAPALAAAIVALKIAAIAQLVAMAVTFVLDQALAAVTFGLAELALAAIEELGVQAIKFVIEQIRNSIIAQLIEAAVEPLEAHVEQLVENMVFSAVNAGMDVATGSSVKLSPDRMRSLIQVFNGYGDEVMNAGSKFSTNVQSLTFSEG